MKNRFSTIDITAVIRELLRFVSMRVVNVYDVDSKTYLIRLGKPDDKAMILIESGIRIHSTEFEWPKNPAPSGFSMKMRKHIKGRRLESVQQLGVDRIVDLTFGSGEAGYHVILELYDRGNIVLTDYTYTILNILRPRTDQSEDVKFAVREVYPINAGKQHECPTEERLKEMLEVGKDGDHLKKLLMPNLDYGPAMIDHCLLVAGFPNNVKVGKGFNISTDMPKLLIAIEEAESLLNRFQTQNSKGYIIQKSEKRPASKEGEPSELLTFDEFHPMLFKQHEKTQFLEYTTFNTAIDQFYSQMESQKLELKTLQQEKAALKKLDNIRKDHEKRVEDLQMEQETDKMKGQLIEMNLDLVDRAILIVRSAIANQIDWLEIQNLVKEAQMDGDHVAMTIKDLKLSTNHITLMLQNPYVDSDFEDGTDDVDDDYPVKPMKVDIDLGLSAYANSRKYFEKKKQAAVKEQKTMDASGKALKSAERKTKETLKDVATAASINKARKSFWFEKFLWFISSENFLIIGGRDQQQNELLVKRYMKQGDIYVHADLHGASSVIIKNHTGESVPPKTLNEAGTMAICNSAAWDAKVVTSAWWVYPSQVSKTAPSGEYLTTGSFMIRGKKNFLPPSYLIYGFGFLFKLEEGSVFRHTGERKVRIAEDDEISVVGSLAESEVTLEAVSDEINESADESVKSDEDDSNNEDHEYYASANLTVDVVTTAGDNSCDSVNVKDELIGSVNTDKNKNDTTDSAAEETKQVEPCKGVEFPDTEISLHAIGGKYQLNEDTTDNSTDYEPVYLGDDKPLVFGEKKVTSGPKLSAKQRKEMKKSKKQGQQTPQNGGIADNKKGDENVIQSSVPKEILRDEEEHKLELKRGHKGKMKKMKEKYKDQDEEERQLCMAILASAGTKKEDKKKKDKKGEDKNRPLTAGGGKKTQQQQKGSWKKPELVDIIIEDVLHLKTEDTVSVCVESVPVAEEEDKMEEDNLNTSDDQQALNSLTGLPTVEDELLFAIPVCAPYNALTSYKYKVKLLPGSTKRGKAAKTALNMFLCEKNITPREKDLLKILKDVDMSRNIPGKVKVTAPNLNKIKRK